jgi:hypothetical protein
LKLQRFWSVATALQLEEVWVLVDKVDEAPGTQTAPAIFDCIADLLLAENLMEFRVGEKQVMCFKVFLTHPRELQHLLKSAGFRTDRIKSESIAWSRKDLDSALTKRLVHFSNHNIGNFSELCAQDAQQTHDRLLDECDLRPRTLFRMAHEIFCELQRSGDSTADKLSKSMVDAGIRTAKEAVVG